MKSDILRKQLKSLLENGLTQTQLSRLSGVSQPIISAFVSGKQKSVSFDIGMKLVSLIESTPATPASTPETAEADNDE